MTRYYIIAIEAPDTKPFRGDVSRIRQLIQEDMPYLRVIFTRDSPNIESLEEPIKIKKKE